MPAAHRLKDLIAWARRAEWRGAMADALARHVALACAEADLEIEDLWDVLDDADQGAIWGAAFEDLLASDLPDGRNLADDCATTTAPTGPFRTVTGGCRR